METKQQETIDGLTVSDISIRHDKVKELQEAFNKAGIRVTHGEAFVLLRIQLINRVDISLHERVPNLDGDLNLRIDVVKPQWAKQMVMEIIQAGQEMGKAPPRDPPARNGESALLKLAEIGRLYPSDPDMPTDGAANVDHYLYGAPKQESTVTCLTTTLRNGGKNGE